MTDQVWLTVCVTATIVLCFAVTIVPILLGFGHSRRKLELEHAERMKAIELGQPVPRLDQPVPRLGEGQEEAWTVAARLAKAIGVTVPLGSLGWAFIASLSLGYHQEIWIVGGMVALAGVLCGALLAGQSFSAEKSSPERDELKPDVDEDAYDVVSARG